MDPVKQRFDIYRQSYDPSTNRITSKLIVGGYTTWSDATIAEYILAQASKIVSFTIKPCTHTDSVYLSEKHSALLKESDLAQMVI